jgi:hypothetical protein
VRPFVTNGEVWEVVRVPAGDPRLVDRTDMERLATTDPSARVVWLRDDLVPPLLDRVLLHEVAHAVTLSWGLLGGLRSAAPRSSWVPLEEWAARLVESHAIETVDAAASALGRPVCVRGLCYGRADR